MAILWLLRVVYGLSKGLFGTSFMACLRGYLERFYGSFRGYNVGCFVGILYFTFSIED